MGRSSRAAGPILNRGHSRRFGLGRGDDSGAGDTHGDGDDRHLKFKLDENLDVRLAAAMQAKGLDSDTVLSEALSGISDEGIFEVCKTTDRVLITLDLDFASIMDFDKSMPEVVTVYRMSKIEKYGRWE